MGKDSCQVASQNNLNIVSHLRTIGSIDKNITTISCTRKMVMAFTIIPPLQLMVVKHVTSCYICLMQFIKNSITLGHIKK